MTAARLAGLERPGFRGAGASMEFSWKDVQPFLGAALAAFVALVVGLITGRAQLRTAEAALITALNQVISRQDAKIEALVADIRVRDDRERHCQEALLELREAFALDRVARGLPAYVFKAPLPPAPPPPLQSLNLVKDEDA